MTKTLFVQYRDNGFWAYDVGLSVFLKHLIDAAGSCMATPEDTWLRDVVASWQSGTVACNLGFLIEDTWSPAETKLFVRLAEEACKSLEKRDAISAEEVASWPTVDGQQIFLRGASEVLTGPILELGRAMIELVRGTLPRPPHGTLWTYGTPDGRSTSRSRPTYTPQFRIRSRTDEPNCTGEAVFVCNWRRSPEGFALWVKSQPTLCSQHLNYATAEEQLIDTIKKTASARIGVLEFDPPLPASEPESRFSYPDLLLISGSESIKALPPGQSNIPSHQNRDWGWLDSFFEEPVCRVCSCASSPRSEKPLQLTDVPSRHCGATVDLAGLFTDRQIFAQAFVDLLTPEERSHLMLRKVDCTESDRTFWELIGPSGPSAVAVAGLAPEGWFCEACRHRKLGYFIDGFDINDFVASSDLPRQADVFTIGGSPTSSSA